MNTAETNPSSPAPAAMPAPESKKLPQPIRIHDLETVFAWHRTPVELTLTAYGQVMQFSGQRLLPKEVAMVRNLTKQAIPPRNEKGEYVFDDPAFLAESEKHRFQARAQALIIGYGHLFKPIAEKKNAAITNLEDLAQFIQSLEMGDDILEALFNSVVHEDVGVVDLTSFFSGGSSPQN